MSNYSKELTATLGVRGLLLAAGLVSSVITARLLGPEGRGIFFYWASIAAFVIQFGNLGLHVSNSYFLTKGQKSLASLNDNAMLVSLIIGGVSLLAYLAFALGVDNLPLSGDGQAAAWFALFASWALVPSGLYFLLGSNLLIALGRITHFNRVELLNRYGGIAALLVVAWAFTSPALTLWATAITSGVMAFYLYRALHRIGSVTTSAPQSPLAAVDWHLLREGAGYSTRAWLVAGLAFGVQRCGVILLERWSTPHILGQWSMAIQLLDVINLLPITIAMILLPRLLRADDPWTIMRQQLWLVTGLLIGVIILTLLLGKPLILWLYGERFLESWPMLVAGLGASFAYGLASVVGQYLVAEGMPFQQIPIWLMGLLSEILLAWWLIPRWQGIGAMIGLSISFAVVLALQAVLVIYLRRKSNHG